MSFTKVAPAGIGTSPGNSILIGDSLLHSTGIDIGSNTGAGVTIRQHGDATFTGIITASAFFGDGSGLEGVSSSGIGTPLSDDDTSDLNKIYYVNQELSIGSTVTVNHPSSAVASYTHYQDLVVTDDADFIVADGDTFIPDVLGIRTSTSTASAATGGRIRAGTITNAGANGAPNFPNGLTGTSGTFTGAINAASGTITGNLGVGGVLTYEDVTNVDSIGIITARAGVNIVGNDLNVGSNIKLGNASGIITATSFRGDASQMTGAGLGTDGSANTSGIITATAFVPTTGQLSHRNLIINGAMNVAQRATSSTANGYAALDRYRNVYNAVDEAPTQSQVDVAAGTTPYTLGFRKALRITNGNQTSGAGAGDGIEIWQRIESQNMACSGWNYVSDSSFVTLQFWIKSSVAQNFQGYVLNEDTNQNTFPFETGSLSANTWTKVTKVIPGNSNLTFNNDNGTGLRVAIVPFLGTDYTSNGLSLDTWVAYNHPSNFTRDCTTTWYTTNDATLEITGLQLEVGPVATPFEHRTIADELARCQRYCVQYNSNNASRDFIMPAKVLDGDDADTAWQPPVAPRTTYPTISVSNASHICLSATNNDTYSPVNISSRDNTAANPYSPIVFLNFDLNSSPLSSGDMVFLAFANNTSGGYIRFDWEL